MEKEKEKDSKREIIIIAVKDEEIKGRSNLS